MHFLAPLWLGGLAALALPLVLHLLSRGRGRRVPLASTRLLETALSVRGRRLKPSDLALLLVRGALLAAVALALAEPWVDAAPSAAAGSWLLVEPGLEAILGAPVKQDSVDVETLARWRREASVKRYLAPGLPEADPGAVAGAPDVWSLLAEADRAAPPGAELRVATRGRAAELHGRRPSLLHPVRWLAIDRGTPSTTLGTASAGLLVAAGPAADAGVVALLERGSRELVRLERTTVPVGGTADGVTASVAGGLLRVSSADGRVLEVERATPLAVALHADAAHGASAALWRRAFDVGAAALGARLVWAELPAGAALRLWLDDAPPPAAWRDGGLLVTEARSPGAPCSERVAADGEQASIARCEDSVASDPEASGVPPAEWLSAGGRGFLIQEHGTREVHLATRLDAAWSDLARTSALPRQCSRWVEELLVERHAVAFLSSDDPRAVAEAQRLPGVAPAPAGAPSAERHDASAGFWLAAAVLLAVERLLAARAAPAVQRPARAGASLR